MAKRIMEKFRIDEISAVTKPAQAGARALIMKRDFSAKDREKDADSGAAMPDGSFPIKTKEDLGNAIKLAGKAKDPEAARAHIKRRAKALGAEDSIPDTWKSADPVSKGLVGLTEPNFGHAHSFRLDHYTLATGGGETDFRQNDLEDGSHSHPFVINADGSVTIGMSAGHDHEVEGTVEDILLGSVPDTDGDNENEMAAEGGEQDDSVDDTAGSVVKAKANEVDMNEKELAELRALAAMTDVQKAHFVKLDAGEKEAFVKMGASERKAEIAKARESDPIVYKSERTGREFRASDNPEVIALAKDVDGLTSVLKVTASQNEEKAIDDLVAKMANLGAPNGNEDKRKLAKSLLAIQDEDARKLAVDALLSKNELAEKLFKAIGVPTVGNGILASANDELKKMAQDRATATGESFHKAYDVVLRSPEGKRLYAETIRVN